MIEYIARVKSEPNPTLSHAVLLELCKMLTPGRHVLRPLWSFGRDRPSVRGMAMNLNDNSSYEVAGFRNVIACWNDRMN